MDHATGTEIAFHTYGQRKAARYVSDTTVLEEALDGGRWIGLYWSAQGQVQRENVVPGLPGIDPLFRPAHAFELEIDGQSLINHWEWVGGSERPGERAGTREAVVELRHRVRPVTIKIITRIDGSPVLVRYLEITNTGEKPAALAAVSPCSGVLWNTNTERPGHFSHANPAFDAAAQPKFTLGYFTAEEQLEEGDFVWQPIPRESFRVERKWAGRSFGPPYYVLRNEVSGEMFFIGLAWSGPFAAEFSNRFQSLLSFRIGPAAPPPLRVIVPGETIRSPELHIGPMHGTFDGAIAQWHRHMRATVIPPRPADKQMYTIAGRVVEEPGEWILREIDIAAEMGAEAFMVDAGWYGREYKPWPANRGDWLEGSWLPGGLAGIRDYTHKKKMLFGLWHEAEAISDVSELAKAHPEWMLRTDQGAGQGRGLGHVLDLANPDAAKFFEESVVRIVRDHKLDFYKLDYNQGPGEGGQTVHSGFSESEFWRHNEVLYRTYDRVLRECPDVCLENCASGGGRNDLGMASRFHYLCESDWSILPYAIRAINTLSFFIPPESIAYYHNHVNWMGVQAHQLGDIDAHLRVSLFAVPIFVGFGGQNTDRSTIFFQKTRKYIELHKGFCRPVLAGKPLVYHHTPDIGLFKPAEWCALEYGRPDRTRGYAGVFKLTGGPGEYLLHPQGIDAGRSYEVTLDNDGQRFRIAGHELARQGLRVALDRPLTSELVLYAAV